MADVTIQAKSVGNDAYGQNIGENAFPASASGIDSCQVSFCHFVYVCICAGFHPGFYYRVTQADLWWL